MKFEPFVNQLRKRVRRVHPEWTKMKRVFSDPYRTDGPRGMMMWLHGANLSLDHRLAIVVLDRPHFYDPEPQRILMEILSEELMNQGYEGRIRFWIWDRQLAAKGEIGEFYQHLGAFIEGHPAVQEEMDGTLWYEPLEGEKIELTAVEGELTAISSHNKISFSTIEELEGWIYEQDPEEREMVEWQQRMITHMDEAYGDQFWQRKGEHRLLTRYFFQGMWFYRCKIPGFSIATDSWTEFAEFADANWDYTMRKDRLRNLL